MKKSNVTVIATVLIALHVLVFAIFFGQHHNQKQRLKSAKPASSPAADPIPDNSTPKQKPARPAHEVIPVEVTEMKSVKTIVKAPAPTRESIATPGSRAGYLRSDQPSRRTSKVYSKLTGNPFRGAIVVDARTGKILFEQRATTYAYPASVTKLMTMLLVLEHVDAGKTSLSDKVAITKEGTGVGGSQVYLDIRESGAFTVNDLLNALMIHSANDAARILGIHVAGSKTAFVELMNKKARELGMNATVYHSEHGLPPTDGSQPDISTPYDIALLSMAALRHPETLRYSGTKLAYLPLSPIRKEKFMLANRNVLVGRAPYQGCDGLKTGYHGMGGWSLTATAERNGQRVISVVLGSPDKATRNATSRKMLDKGFEILNH
jgi:D-alanyl-D-alanine carboxypeptidase (penicillin-binding protein 5/6)